MGFDEEVFPPSNLEFLVADFFELKAMFEVVLVVVVVVVLLLLPRDRDDDFPVFFIIKLCGGDCLTLDAWFGISFGHSTSSLSLFSEQLLVQSVGDVD